MSTTQERLLNLYQGVGDVVENIGKPVRFSGQLAKNILTGKGPYEGDEALKAIDAVFIPMYVVAAFWGIGVALTTSLFGGLAALPLTVRAGFKVASGIERTTKTWKEVEKNRRTRIEQIRFGRRLNIINNNLKKSN